MSIITPTTGEVSGPSLTEVQGLFIPTTSEVEKWAIKIALDAITDPSNKTQVLDLTKTVIDLIPSCASGRESIISALAAKLLSKEEWLKVIDLAEEISRGLDNGKDIAGLLDALAALPAEKQELCNENTHLFASSLPIEDRLRLLNALVETGAPEDENEDSQQTDSLTSGLSDSEKTQIIQHVLKITKNRRITIFMANEKITPTMSAEDRLEVLSTQEAILWRCRLIKRTMRGDEKLQLKKAVESISEEKRDDINDAISLHITKDTSVEDIILLLNAVDALPIEAVNSLAIGSITSFIQPKMGISEKIRVMNAIAGISMLLNCDELRVAMVATKEFILPEMTVDDRLQILTAVASLGPTEQMTDLSNRARELITPTMNADEIVAQINSLRPRNNHNASLSTNNLIVDISKIDGYVNEDGVIRPQNPMEVLENLIDKFDEIGSFPEITFQNAQGRNLNGADAGGLSRDLVTLLMKAVCQPQTQNERKLPMITKDMGVVPTIEKPSHLKSYRAIGMIFSMAMSGTQSILTRNHFNPVVFQMIHALTQEEIDQIPANLSDLSVIPQALQNSVLKLYLKSEMRSAFGDINMDENQINLEIDNFLERNVINSWMSEFAGITNKETFFLEKKLNEILLATLVIAKSMQQSLRQPNKWDKLKKPTSEELRISIEGTLSKDLVIQTLTYEENDGTVSNDLEKKAWIETWVRNATESQLENFVLSITGSPTLRIIDPVLSIRFTVDERRLPGFHTCTFEMDLPKYATYEIFKEKLEFSMENALTGDNRFELV